MRLRFVKRLESATPQFNRFLTPENHCAGPGPTGCVLHAMLYRIELSPALIGLTITADHDRRPIRPGQDHACILKQPYSMLILPQGGPQGSRLLVRVSIWRPLCSVIKHAPFFGVSLTPQRQGSLGRSSIGPFGQLGDQWPQNNRHLDGLTSGRIGAVAGGRLIAFATLWRWLSGLVPSRARRSGGTHGRTTG